MTGGAPQKGDKPGFIALLVFAGFSAIMALLWATSSDWGPSIGFAILAVAQVIYAFRTRRRDRVLEASAVENHPTP